MAGESGTVDASEARGPRAAGAEALAALGDWDRARIAVVAVAAGAVGLLHGESATGAGAIGVAATLFGGSGVFKHALASLRERRMTMELSMTIALLAALSIGEFLTALVILLFVLVAEVLENLTVRRGRRAIKVLLDQVPPGALVFRDGREQEIDAGQVRLGDVLVVRPGARFPADGVVIGGHSFADQSPITGESLPAEKVPGAEVFAGTLNQSGALRVRVERLGADTAFGRIIEAVERAEKSRAPIQRIADRLSGYIVYFALGCAALTLVMTRDARATISVILIAGACGVATGNIGVSSSAMRHCSPFAWMRLSASERKASRPSGA